MSDSKNQKPGNEQEQPMSDAQRQHHDELYNYKRDEEGTLDTSAMLEQETLGIPDDTISSGANPHTTGDPVDDIINEGNNALDDNNR